MIITQTPLRISFFGGGTDFANFYRHEGGCVLSSAIDKFAYVIVKERFDKKIRIGYTRTELVDRVDEIQHELARAALQITGLDSKIEIDTIADIPATGSGLASSSSVTVGILNALYAYLNILHNHDDLARLACQIEIDRLKKPIGKQDQYIVAYGGLRFIHFHQDDSVTLETVKLSERERLQLGAQLMLFYTNTARSSESVLSEQNSNIQNNFAVLRDMKAMAYHGRELLEQGNFDEFGRLLHEGWMLKKKLARKISNTTIDEIYKTARQAGAFGGKITGAGGGGFILLYCPPERQQLVRQALSAFQELPFELEPFGTKVIFNYRH
jgi:D-glycero-alpha-D-manno-heptose-7-phosphate kinase